MVSALDPSNTRPSTPKISRSADNAGSPDKAVDSSKESVRAAPSLPADPPASPVMVEVLAEAT